MFDRRNFLRTSTAALTAASYSRVLGANDRIGFGIVGTGSRGSYLMREMSKLDDVRWSALCDIYDVRLQQAKAKAPDAKTFADYRELLAASGVDAVIIATPDHWHAAMTIDACRAGKDVYVEKPMTSQPQQGVEVCRVVSQTKRIVQVGTQQRSGPHYIEAFQKVIKRGLLGKVGLVRCWYNSNGGYLYKPPEGMEKKPDGLNWDRYLGWLPKIPWDAKRYFNRFAYFDISTGGQTGGLFVHLVDTVNWYLNIDKPSAVYAGGGIYQFDDGRDTPDVVNMICEYPQKLNVTFEAEVLTVGVNDDVPKAAMEFHGTGGILVVYRDPAPLGWVYSPNQNNKAVGRLSGPYVSASAEPHLRNWVECIRTRQRPVADEVAGHYGAMPCHMGNMALKSRNRVDWSRKWDLRA